ncbi:hypothetical protein CCACVL1_25261 [Corchorus capsularis]|uniref:Uncharacterized protein n=1 Tax=Corchorus capsularis TaxID=210143 RepID=A0A1R3GLJ7_COCAP|nr:hypothetical protein CCACVL1_25261 [Corchorus capsularis]
MATESSLDANINTREIRAVPEEDEGNYANWFDVECAIKDILGHEPNLDMSQMVVFMKDDDHVSNKVLRFYNLAKFWPYKDQYEESKIQVAEKLIKQLDQESIPLIESYTRKQVDRFMSRWENSKVFRTLGRSMQLKAKS